MSIVATGDREAAEQLLRKAGFVPVCNALNGWRYLRSPEGREVVLTDTEMWAPLAAVPALLSAPADGAAPQTALSEEARRLLLNVVSNWLGRADTSARFQALAAKDGFTKAAEAMKARAEAGAEAANFIAAALASSTPTDALTPQQVERVKATVINAFLDMGYKSKVVQEGSEIVIKDATALAAEVTHRLTHSTSDANTGDSAKEAETNEQGR